MGTVKERWLPISGYEKYSVSSAGRIRTPSGRVVYRSRRCRLMGLHKKTQPTIAHIVYEHFGLPLRSKTYTVIHKDGDELNNDIINLDVAPTVKAEPTPTQLEAYNAGVYKVIYAEIKRNNYAEARKNGFDIDNCIQECALKIYRVLPAYDVTRSFYTWSRSIISSVFKSQLSRFSKRLKHEVRIDDNLERFEEESGE